MQSDECRRAAKSGCIAVIFAAAFIVLVGAVPAIAGGSVALDEIMPILARSSKLEEEVKAELLAQNQSSADVSCSAVRLGRQWDGLGGARVGPYECDFRTRRLTVKTRATFFDINGISISGSDAALAKRAKNIVESEPVWEWTLLK